MLGGEANGVLLLKWVWEHKKRKTTCVQQRSVDARTLKYDWCTHKTGIRIIYLRKGGHEVERVCQLAVPAVDHPAAAEVQQVERQDPEVDGQHHVGPRGLEAAVDAILLGVGDAVENQVNRHLHVLRGLRDACYPLGRFGNRLKQSPPLRTSNQVNRGW